MTSYALKVLGAPHDDVFATINAIASLQTLMAAKMEHAKREQKATEDELRQCHRYEQSRTDKTRSLKKRLQLMEQSLRGVKERKKECMASKAWHNTNIQYTASCQIDLERLAKMQEDMARGLQALNLDTSSFEKALATAMAPAMQEFQGKYADILGDGTKVKIEASS